MGRSPSVPKTMDGREGPSEAMDGRERPGILAIPGGKIKEGIPGRPQAGPIFFGYRRRVSEKQGEIDALEIDAP